MFCGWSSRFIAKQTFSNLTYSLWLHLTFPFIIQLHPVGLYFATCWHGAISDLSLNATLRPTDAPSQQSNLIAFDWSPACHTMESAVIAFNLIENSLHNSAKFVKILHNYSLKACSANILSWKPTEKHSCGETSEIRKVIPRIINTLSMHAIWMLLLMSKQLLYCGVKWEM